MRKNLHYATNGHSMRLMHINIHIGRICILGVVSTTIFTMCAAPAFADPSAPETPAPSASSPGPTSPSGSTSASPAPTAPTPSSASPSVAAVPLSSVAALNYRVYGTREGLVGGHTASGHTIANRDHFVALPSQRALNLSVQVCYGKTGKCETTPVWDVGPWNTRDDYWNPSSARESFTDLPQGKPEAQAAKEDGYNGGHDEEGRAVSNQAGIDLADGTFWDALGMTDNDWVQVTYLWTGGNQTTINSGGGLLNVRSGATTDSDIVAALGDGSSVVVNCTVNGTSVAGTAGTTSAWGRLSTGGYVAAAYLNNGQSLGVGAC